MPETKVTFDAADDYERLMGRWSRAIGEKFLDWLTPAANADWLDVGCGTGAFTELVLKRCAPKSVSGIDPAPAQIEHARKHFPAADFRTGEATTLPFGDAQFDIVASALVINFIPDRPKALTEMRRVLRDGGVVAAYLWDRSAAADLSPHSPMEHGLLKIGVESLRPPAAPESTPGGAKAALEHAGFSDIAVTSIEATQTFRDFDDYWQTQTLRLAPVGKTIAALTDAQRTQLRETMHSILPPAADGSITYASRALAFSARKPA
jgi:ubiquinone/menaquinone biosynthesis C-methylase UbiE